MPIVAVQWAHLVISAGAEVVSTAQTIRLDRGNLSAEIALSSTVKTSRGGASHEAEAKITEVFSSVGVEQPMVSVIGRAGMTMITFRLTAFNGSAIARWIISRWE